MLIKYFVWMRIALCLICIGQIQSCGTPRWYSVEQEPAKPFAYIHNSVFVSNDYVRVATIREIDGNEVDEISNGNLKISLGRHQVKIYCDEAKGTYDSNALTGQAKVLEFEATIQRTYKAACHPYTHWWIEDSDSMKVVAGKKPAT